MLCFPVLAFFSHATKLALLNLLGGLSAYTYK